MPKAQVYLTDAQMAVLVEMTLDGARPFEVARIISAPYFTVHKAMKRVRERGWVTPIINARCSICGTLMVVPRVIPAWSVCSGECQDERSRRRSRAQVAAHPGLSTSYVREWRLRNPGKVLASRIRETDRTRGKPTAKTPEQRVQHNEVSARGQRAKYEATLALAENHGQEWTSDEDQYIVENNIMTNTAIAYALGRTYHGVRGRRSKLRKLGLLPVAD